jgi:hypothetical protein
VETRKWLLCTFQPSLMMAIWNEATELTSHLPTSIIPLCPSKVSDKERIIHVPLVPPKWTKYEGHAHLASTWSHVFQLRLSDSSMFDRSQECTALGPLVCVSYGLQNFGGCLHHISYSSLMVDRRPMCRIECRRLDKAVDLRLQS